MALAGPGGMAMRCVLGASCLILAIVLVGCGPSSGSVDRDGDGATDALDAECTDAEDDDEGV